MPSFLIGPCRREVFEKPPVMGITERRGVALEGSYDSGRNRIRTASMTDDRPPAALPGTLAQKGLLIVGLPTVLQLAFLGMIMVQNHELERTTNSERHYRQLLTSVGQMALESFQVCGHLNNLMAKPDKESLIAVGTNLQHLEERTNEIRKAASFDPATAKICYDFGKTADELMDIFRSSTGILFGGLTRDTACELFEYRQRFQVVVPQFLEQHKQLLDLSLRLSKKVSDLQEKRRIIQRQWILSAAIASAALCLFIGVLFSREIRSRLAVIKKNTQLLGTGRKLLPPVGGQDEIHDLDSTFRQMAAALDEAKEQERALVTESQDMICSLDSEGRLNLFNPATAAILGVNADGLAGHSFFDLIAPASIEILRTALELAAQSPQLIELATLNADAGAKFLSVNINWSEKQQSFFVAAHDITRRKELEQMQRELYAMIAHDVRSPLMSAKASIELTIMGVADDKQRLQKAERSIDRVTHLINDLLDMEKLSSGKFEICAEKCCSSDVVNAAVDSVQGLIESKQLQLHIEMEDFSLYADRELVTRVLFNLCSNAIKFSSPGAGLYVAAVVKGGDARFSVKDEGPGISEEDEKKLFGRFVQVGAHSKTSGPTKGTGLGLAICKMIVEEHDGQIGVNSEVGEGSEFWFTLPLIQDWPVACNGADGAGTKLGCELVGG